MRKLILKLLLIGILIFILDKSLYFFEPILAKNQIDKRLELLITDKIDAEVLVLGSSKAARNIIADTLGEVLGMSCYNLGYPGSNIEFHYYLAQKIVNLSNPPNLVLLTVDDKIFSEREHLNFRFDKLYPLVGFKEINKDLCAMTNKKYGLSKMLYSYKWRESFPAGFIPQPNKILDRVNNDGSMPLTNKSITWDTMSYKDTPSTLTTKDAYQDTLINAFINTLILLEARQIEVVLVVPPVYGKRNLELKYELEQIVDNIVFQDSVIGGTPSSKTMFYDYSHLNKTGAINYSRSLAYEILKDLTTSRLRGMLNG